jgi:mRNA interferase MazF
MAQSLMKRGSVVLIRYPFTDLTGAKVRPALMLTPDYLLPRLEDVLCLFISSVMPEDLLPTDFVLELGHPSFLHTGLKRRSVLRMHKLALLHKTLVLRVAGEGDSRSCTKSINGCGLHWACKGTWRQGRTHANPLMGGKSLEARSPGC